MKDKWYLGYGVSVEQVEASKVKLFTDDLHPAVIYLNLGSCVTLFAYVKDIIQKEINEPDKPTT